jgi:hypothetical protein
MGFNFWWQVEAKCGAMVSSSQGSMHPISKIEMKPIVICQVRDHRVYWKHVGGSLTTTILKLQIKKGVKNKRGPC